MPHRLQDPWHARLMLIMYTIFSMYKLAHFASVAILCVQIVEQLDYDGDGAIDIQEFIAGTLSLYQVARGGLPTQRMLWQNRLKVLFAELDRDDEAVYLENFEGKVWREPNPRDPDAPEYRGE